ncbi:9726_t:CDS:2 [Acaulospora colombiana]|uniref:9726_t:CDS:1 n=1 Tax=Acaulospora colombiana TaxID=27376 RepID=A0ACA9M3R7_9GLOM|nr:9726_t:CDS:2 [Acaulospora colombiana]
MYATARVGDINQLSPGVHMKYHQDEGAIEVETLEPVITDTTNAQKFPLGQGNSKDLQRLLLERLRDGVDDSGTDDSNDSLTHCSSILSFISHYARDYSDASDEFEDVKEIFPQNDRQATTASMISPKFSRLTLGSIRDALNKPKNSRHIKMLSQLNLTAPEINEPIIFESKVAKLSSPAIKKSSKNHLILTRKCLCQFKNAEKAAKIFDGLPLCTLPPKSPDGDNPHGFANSSVLPAENVLITLATVFAVTEDLTPDPHIRLDYISSPKKQSFISIMAPDLQKHRQWLITLRPTIMNSDPIGPYLNSSQRAWIMKKLNQLDDLVDENEEKLIAYRVLLKTVIDEDRPDQGEKEPRVPVLFVLGRSNIYIILCNLSDDGISNENSRRSRDFKSGDKPALYPLLIEDIKPKEINFRKYQYPLLCLTNIRFGGHDDTFSITFKISVGSINRTFVLSSLLYKTIINDVRTAIDSITFWWPNPSYNVQTSSSASTSPSTSIVSPIRDGKSVQEIGLERMIEAQRHAFRVSKSRISFRVDYVMGAEAIVLGMGVEHLPFRFTLLPPKGGELDEDESYTKFELLAVLNSLHHHPQLYEVIFKDINLFELQIQPGPENHKCTNMLAAMVYDLLVSNPKLRKLDLTSCGITGETVVAIGNALFTGELSLEKLFIGNNSITREGIQALATGLTNHGSILKELDLSNCRLTYESLEVILNALDTNNPDQLEILNLSDNTPNQIISYEVLGRTNLTTLDIGRVSLNIRDHLFALYEYIKSPAFSKMKYFIVDHCNLDGEALAIILSYISTSPNYESIRVWAGGNYIGRTSTGCKEFCNAVRNDWTPAWLSLEDTMFGSNADDVVEILSALSENTMLKYLDLSHPRLRIGENAMLNTQHVITAKKACEVIGRLLRYNTGLKELNLSGDSGRRWGSSLGIHLEALEENEVLERLNVRGNVIRDHGAKSLSQGLRSNVALKFLDIDENEISIDGYMALHQVMTTRENVTLQELVYPMHDLQIHNEYIDTKLSINTRDTIFGSSTMRNNQRIASERQKIEFKTVIDQIMTAIEENSKTGNNEAADEGIREEEYE